MLAQTDHAHATVDQRVVLAAPDMPYITAIKLSNMQFADQTNIITEFSDGVPIFCFYALHSELNVLSWWQQYDRFNRHTQGQFRTDVNIGQLRQV